ncbi:MAG: lipase family protein [Planctomycetota bacterium]
MTLSLPCQLMCAAANAYDIQAPSGDYEPTAMFADAVGWTSGPTAYSAGSDNVDAMLVGNIAGAEGEPDALVIAFRGTVAPAPSFTSVKDWIQDLLTHTETVTAAGEPVPGKVHEGFWNALNDLWTDVLKNASAAEGKIYITGHSKGAALAPLAAAALYFGSGIEAAGVYSFAPPHCGNSDFVKGFPSSVPVTRYENVLDVVPLMPPTPEVVKGLKHHEVWKLIFELYERDDYEPLGTLEYIDANGDVQTGSDVLSSVDRLNDILDKFDADDFSTVLDAHCHACKGTSCAGGYMQGACGGAVCFPGA